MNYDLLSPNLNILLDSEFSCTYHLFLVQDSRGSTWSEQEIVTLAMMMVKNSLEVGRFGRATLKDLRDNKKVSGHLQSSLQP